MGTKYSSNSASGYNATPPADDGTVSEANKVKWSTVKTKLADPIKDLADTINSELATHFNNGPVAITSNTTLGASHYNQVIQVSGSSVTLTLTDATTLTAGWYCDIVSTDTSNSVTLARATASDMINETSSDVTILPLQALRVVVNAAANGFLVDLKQRHSKTFQTTNNMTLNGLFTGKTGANIASATTVDLTAATGNLVHITGTTTTTGLTMNSGQVMELIADGAWPLTYHATNLKINGGASYTCVAGDRLIVFYDGTTVYVNVIKQDGTSVKTALYAILEDQKSSGTNGGDFNSGALRTRTLNTEVYDPDGIVSLASNQFTLAAGTYIIEWWASAYSVDLHKSSLYNVTAASTLRYGSSERSQAGDGDRSVGKHGITLASSAAFEIQHQCGTTVATTGFGIATSLGTEVYCQVKITKVV